MCDWIHMPETTGPSIISPHYQSSPKSLSSYTGPFLTPPPPITLSIPTVPKIPSWHLSHSDTRQEDRSSLSSTKGSLPVNHRVKGFV